MKPIKASLLAGMLLIVPAGLTLSQSKTPWMHLEVKEHGTDPTTVKVNLPLPMVEVALNAVKDKDLQRGRIKIPSKDISVADLRRLWEELRKAGNAEFVTVEKKDESVRIAKQDNLVIIKVSGPDKTKPKVDIKVPVAVVDALLDTPGDELNVKGALLAMQKQGTGEILSVNDEKSQVRIWID
ncbi:MAG: hypothetical protein AB1898_18495 [Acidobacteriota bacterium]